METVYCVMMYWPGDPNAGTRLHRIFKEREDAETLVAKANPQYIKDDIQFIVEPHIVS